MPIESRMCHRARSRQRRVLAMLAVLGVRLRAAPRGSGRLVARRYARRPRGYVGDGRTDASGGGFGHRIVES